MDNGTITSTDRSTQLYRKGEITTTTTTTRERESKRWDKREIVAMNQRPRWFDEICKRDKQERHSLRVSAILIHRFFYQLSFYIELVPKKKGESLRAASAKKSHRLPAVSLSSQSLYISPFFLKKKEKEQNCIHFFIYFFGGLILCTLLFQLQSLHLSSSFYYCCSYCCGCFVLLFSRLLWRSFSFKVKTVSRRVCRSVPEAIRAIFFA
jgi:hypothetical protein